MASRYQNFTNGIGIVPNSATTTTSSKGDIDVTTDGKLNYHNGTTSSPIVTESHSATLTNKTLNLSAGNGNLISNIPNSSLSNSSVTINGVSISLGGSGTIKASTTNALTIGTGLSGTSFDGGSAVTIAIDSAVVATLTGSQILTNKTINGSNNTLSNIANSSLSNSTISGVSLGSNLNNLTLGSGLLFLSGTSYNGGTAREIDIDTSIVATLTGIQTLTNKTIIGPTLKDSANTYSVTIPTSAPAANTAFVYDGTNYIWASAGGWNSSVQTSIANGGTITISLSQGQQAIEVAAATSAGAVLSTTPFGSSAPSNNKTSIRLIGTSNTNTITINNSNITKGCLLNGSAVLFDGYIIEFTYLASKDRWYEVYRNF